MMAETVSRTAADNSFQTRTSRRKIQAWAACKQDGKTSRNIIRPAEEEPIGQKEEPREQDAVFVMLAPQVGNMPLTRVITLQP